MILLSHLKLRVFQEKCCLNFFQEVRDFDEVEQQCYVVRQEGFGNRLLILIAEVV